MLWAPTKGELMRCYRFYGEFCLVDLNQVNGYIWWSERHCFIGLHQKEHFLSSSLLTLKKLNKINQRKHKPQSDFFQKRCMCLFSSSFSLKSLLNLSRDFSFHMRVATPAAGTITKNKIRQNCASAYSRSNGVSLTLCNADSKFEGNYFIMFFT